MYYLRDKNKAIPELEFNNLNLAEQVARAMAYTYPIGNYATMYVVRSDNNKAIMSFNGMYKIIYLPSEDKTFS